MSILKSTKTGNFYTLTKELLEEHGLQVVLDNFGDIESIVYFTNDGGTRRLYSVHVFITPRDPKDSFGYIKKLVFPIYVKGKRYDIDRIEKIEYWKDWLNTDCKFDLSEYLK